MRSLRWAGHAALGAAFLLNGVFSVVFFHDRMLGGPYWTYTNDSDLLFALTLLPLSAHLLGGFVSGRLTRSSPGMSGASSPVLSALVAGVKLLFALFFMLDPAVDPRTRSESAGLLFFVVGLFLVYFPFTVLAGSLGGRLGGRLMWTNRR